jgi:subtilase family serine protease
METKGPNEVGREQLRIGRSLALLLLCAGALPLTAQTRDAGLVTLPHHVIGNLSDSSRLPHTLQMEQDPIRLTVVLNLSDEAARDAFADDLENPDSPNYHSIISLSEFTSRFGPTQQAYDAVLAYLRQNGFTLERGSDNRRTLTVNAKRAQAEHAFNVAIEDFRLGDRTFHAITSDPAVPAALAPLIATVAGLSNKAVWTPADQPNPPFPASSATAYNGSLTPAGKTNAGGLPPGLDGTGQTIGLIEFGNFYTSDVENWLKHVGLPSTNIQHLYTATINAESPCYCNSSKEVLLDIAAVMGIAPGADVIVFLASFALYPDENLDDAINLSAQYLIQHEPGRGTLSISWNECEGDVNGSEETTLDGMLKDYATMGVTLFAATGDHGSTCVGKGNNAIPNTISYPAAAPHTVAVGGTGLSVNADNSYLVENWWGFNGGSSAGGFGVSRFAPQPGYQAPLYRGQAFRSVPDVSIEATPGIAVCQATATASPNCNPVGGTSLGAPLWAGIWALGGQASVDAGGNTQTASNGFLARSTRRPP